MTCLPVEPELGSEDFQQKFPPFEERAVSNIPSDDTVNDSDMRAGQFSVEAETNYRKSSAFVGLAQALT